MLSKHLLYQRFVSQQNRYQALFDSGQKNSFSVLVTDDDLRMRESVRDLLDVYGMQCSMAEDGQQALNLLEQHHYDLVLLDIQMPKVNGLEVMNRIHEKHLDTDVIILSGNASFENARIALRAGAQDFLRKPYNPSELINIINKVFQKRSSNTADLASKTSDTQAEIDPTSDVEKTLIELEGIIEAEDLTLTRNIINASPAVAFLWKNSANWTVQFVSENVVNLMGYTDHEFITGKVIYKDVIHPDDVERVTSEVATDEETITFKHKPYRIISKFGAVKWVDDSSSIIRDEKGNITHYQGILIDVTEREIARQKMLKNQISLEHIAHHDPLTGLPNRLLLLDRLQQSLKKIKRAKKHLALLYIDLDKFKEINDSLGHSAGDEVLKSIAKRLLNNVREVDTVARIGGDEFVILMESVTGTEDVTRVAEKLNKSLQRSLHWQMHEFFVTSSIGISMSPDDTEDPEELMKKADIAMYHSKEQGRNTYQFYHEPKSQNSSVNYSGNNAT